MISAKKATELAKENNDFFERYNINDIITKMALSGHRFCHLAIPEEIPDSAIKALKELDYKVTVLEDKGSFSNPYVFSILLIEW